MVAARIDIENRGLRIRSGESAEVEMTIEHYGQEPIEVGTRWFTDRSGGRFIQNVVTQVLERSRELRSVDTAETAFYVI